MDRFSIFRSNSPSQTTSEMLEVLAKALQAEKSVEVDDAGQLQLADRQREHSRFGLSRFFRSTSEPAQVLFERMIDEASDQMAYDKVKAKEWLEAHVGELQEITYSGPGSALQGRRRPQVLRHRLCRALA